MTTYRTMQLTCACCGHQSSGDMLCSTNSFGGTDLDTRPRGMARAALLESIQSCPKCRYCACDIEDLPEGGRAVIATPEYQSSFTDPLRSALCRKWICFAQVLAASGQESDEAWAILNAAWSCDDAGHSEAATKYRRRSIELFQAAKQRGESFGEDAIAEHAMLVDLFRRVGDFESASQFAQEGLALIDGQNSDNSDVMRPIFQFQSHLASLRDAGVYSTSEAEVYAHGPKKWRPPRWWEFWR